MTPFIGQIQAFGFNFAPRGWTFCNGTLLSISSNTALFSLLGTTFGGDGRTTFGLPDLRGRSIVGAGSGPGLDTITWGEKSGQSQLNLSVLNMPSHNHVATARLGAGLGNTATATNNRIAANAGADTVYTATAAGTDAFAADTIAVANTGGSQPFNSRNPFLGIYVSIALEGVYPSRS